MIIKKHFLFFTHVFPEKQKCDVALRATYDPLVRINKKKSTPNNANPNSRRTVRGEEERCGMPK